MSVARVPSRETPSPAPATRVRSATGADQEWFAGTAIVSDPIDAACELIERCTDGTVTAVEALDLPVGARNALLWQLRWVSFGDQLDAVVECTMCLEKLDVTLSVDEMLGHPDATDGAPLVLRDDGRSVRFRLPTGRDQRSAAAEANPARGLCRRCVIDVDGVSPATLDDVLIDNLIDVLGEAIARTDPRSDTLLAAVCPSCGTDITAELDSYSFVREELLAGAARVLEDVHLLASQYHWSERDILALSIGRRRAYLDLIATVEQL